MTTSTDAQVVAAEVTRLLTDLIAITPLLEALADTRQTDRSYHDPADRPSTGPALPNIDTGLNMDAVTIAVELDTTALAEARHLRRRLLIATKAPTRFSLIPRKPEAPTTRDRLRHLEALTWLAGEYLEPHVLDQVRRRLERIAETATRVVDGEDRMALGLCPWCRRDTVVAHFREGVIRCERDRATGHYEPCRCADPYCPCVADTGHRHEWLRIERAGAVSGWWRFDKLRRTLGEPAIVPAPSDTTEEPPS